MATKADVDAAVQAISDKVDTLATDSAAASQALTDEIARVESLIAAGGGVIPADLQTILDNLTGVQTKAQAVDDQVNAIKATATAERP